MNGQLMAFKVLMFFIALIIFVTFLPAINSVVTTGIASADSMTTIIFQVTPFILLLALLVWLFMPRYND
jgi:hypothetical protein